MRSSSLSPPPSPPPFLSSSPLDYISCWMISFCKVIIPRKVKASASRNGELQWDKATFQPPLPCSRAKVKVSHWCRTVRRIGPEQPSSSVTFTSSFFSFFSGSLSVCVRVFFFFLRRAVLSPRSCCRTPTNCEMSSSTVATVESHRDSAREWEILS